MNRTLLKYLWLGMALGSMFFYPLISTLSDASYYLHWEPSHSGELALAWIVLSILFASALAYSFERAGPRMALVIFMITGFLPFSSMSVHVMKQLKLGSMLSEIALISNIRLVVPIVALLLLLIAFLNPNPALRNRIRTVFLIALMIISPLSIVSVLTVINATTIPVHAAIDAAGVASGNSSTSGPEGSTYLILFDEMSYEYMYENGRIKKDFASFRELSLTADNYHNASSPGIGTMTSIPYLLNAKEGSDLQVKGSKLYIMEEGEDTKEYVPLPGNLFSLARKKGYKTALHGWYHDYCKIFTGVLDDCRSLSIYNYSSSAGGFSLFNPIYTSFNLWPYVFPTGYVKNISSLMFHRNSVQETSRYLLTTVQTKDTYFYFVHFCIPHMPFVFDYNGYNPPSDPFYPSDKKYINQLRYADRLFGEFIKGMRDSGKLDLSTIVIMSDHNFRDSTRITDLSRIPLIIKKSHQNVRRDINVPTKALAIVRDLLTD